MRQLKVIEHVSLTLECSEAMPSGIVADSFKASGPLKNLT
jgi:hypothetical protein